MGYTGSIRKYKIIILTGALRLSGSATWSINLTRAFCQEGHDAVLLAMGSEKEVPIPTDLNAVLLGEPRTNLLVRMLHFLLVRKISKSICKKLENRVYSQRIKKFLKTFEADHPTDLVIKDFNTSTPEIFTGKKHLAVIHEVLLDKHSEQYAKFCARKQDPYTSLAAVCQFCAQYWQQNGFDVQHVLYNPLHIEDIKKKAEAFTVDDDYVVFVGALISRKNVDALLEAWYGSGIKQKLYYVGSGDKQAVLQKRAQELGVSDRVVFTGFAANPFPYIKSAKALILPSHNETMGYVCFEALALNTPIIVGKFRGAEEFYNESCMISITPKKSFNERLAKAIADVVQHTKTDQATLEASKTIKEMSFSSVVRNYLRAMDM